MEKKKAGLKKKLIGIGVIAVLLLLMIGSFFLRDILLRTGVTEYERDEILQVKDKYSTALTNIIAASQDCDNYMITVIQQGLFEKSVIEYDENSLSVKEKCGDSVDVLCHSYCYGITLKDGKLYFDFNQSGTKQLVYGGEISFGEESELTAEDLGNGWTYIQPQQ
ncbi:MAG: hypothetical protein J1E39_09185 [Eubacterium sp.]|nr:hypothetical protein [Eubacterium sp.]